jgi:catechol 2,3-dioxygenase-like lactoylglutathione lyase family enzyme
MLGAARAVAFVGVRDLGAARGFYGDLLGLPIRDEAPFALVAEAGGTVVRITAVPEPVPCGYTVLGWEVPDVPAAVRTLASSGLAFLRFEGIQQDADGVWTAPGGTRVAWFHDPDGNTLSLSGPG